MPKPKAVRIILIRSGSTEWDLSGRVSGSADHPMCEQGAAALAETVKSLDLGTVEAVLHSPDESSRATGEVVASLARAKAKAKDGLAEVAMGLWEGLLPADLEDRYPTVYSRWLDDPLVVQVPEGEPIADADERLRGAFVKAIEKVPNEGVVVLVLRPIAWALMRCRLLGRPLSELWMGTADAPQVESLECQLSTLQDAGVGADRAAARA
ncbi:MAG: histidine phosphatase family protein [Planctomycetota bacterium]